MPIEAVILDYKTVFGLDPAATRHVRELLEWLDAQGLRWCLRSTDRLDVATRCARYDYPEPDAYVHQGDVVGRPGSPGWVNAAAEQLGVERNELLYVGCSTLDWRSAVNAGVFYLDARWAARSTPERCLRMDGPQDVRRFIEQFLMRPPAWSHRLDGPGWSLRSLLPASARLPRGGSGGTFTLQDVFTYKRPVTIGGGEARSLLMLHVIASAYLEGLLPSNAFLCVYPGSGVGTVNHVVADYLESAAVLVGGFYRPDLLVRGTAAPDTSRLRAGGRHSEVSIATQATTVHLDPAYRKRNLDRTVVVVDDFTTAGMSLEWARLLLAEAGVPHVVMLTVGKYGSSHRRYALVPGTSWDPFALNVGLRADSFSVDVRDCRAHDDAVTAMTSHLDTWVAVP